MPVGTDYPFHCWNGLSVPLLERIIRSSAHLGNPCRERRSHFAVYFTVGFNNKTVRCTMNELYLTGATHEAACAHCTVRKYSRKRVTQKPRPSEAWFFYKKCWSLIDLQLLYKNHASDGFWVTCVWSLGCFIFFRSIRQLNFDFLIFVCFVEHL